MQKTMWMIISLERPLIIPNVSMIEIYHTIKNIKWIILDDNSTDDTLDKIYKSYINKEIIKISSSGLFHAYNISYKFLFNKNLRSSWLFINSNLVPFI